MSGKGPTRRPQQVSEAEMAERWERTFGLRRGHAKAPRSAIRSKRVVTPKARLTTTQVKYFPDEDRFRSVIVDQREVDL